MLMHVVPWRRVPQRRKGGQAPLLALSHHCRIVQSPELFGGQRGDTAMICLTQPAPFLQMSPPPSGFGERGGGGGSGPLSHFYSGSPTSYFTSALQAGLKQSHLNKVRSLPD